MKRICLALPTNRLCGAAIAGLLEEAIFALQQFDVAVVLLISDTSPSAIWQENACALQQAIAQHQLSAAISARLQCLHYTPAQQREILHSICQQAGQYAGQQGAAHQLQVLLQILLPEAVSYGAATNRLFLFAAYLGCSSLHRRDSDSRYQVYQGEKLFPIAQELRYIGMPADQAAAQVDQIIAAPCSPTYPVVLVGASYLGELSIDVAPMFARDADAAYKIVGLFAPSNLPDAEKRRWVDDSYLQTGQTSFCQELAELGHAHSFLIDTCNLCFSQLQEVFPLPNACNTLGSDYFLMSLMNIAGLPAVHHHRHIENFYTPERRTQQGFIDYQFRLVKFLLYMSWLHAVMQALAAEFGPDHKVLRTAVLLPEHAASSALAAVHATFAQPKADAELAQENRHKLIILQQQYQELGGEYAEFASALAAQAEDLLHECAADYAAYAEFARLWPSLIRAAKTIQQQQNINPTNRINRMNPMNKDVPVCALP